MLYSSLMSLVSRFWLFCGRYHLLYILNCCKKGDGEENFELLFILNILIILVQVKAFIRGDAPPFTAGQLEGIASIVNMHTRVAKRLFSSSLRYWIIEFLRRQPKEKKFRALILRFIKDRTAALLLMEVKASHLSLFL